MNNTTAIILAAGLGKRMNDPETPKVLFSILDKPLLGYVVDVLQNLSSINFTINESIYVIGHHREKVKTFISDYYSSNNINHKFDFAIQKEQLGTGHAVNQAKDVIKSLEDNILILCGDVPFLTSETIEKFINFHIENKSDVSVLSTIAPNPRGYGRIVRNENGEFKQITEEKDATDEIRKIDEVNSGIYYLKAELLFDLLKNVNNKNVQNEYYLTDIIQIAISNNTKVNAYPIADFDELQGINTQEELLEAEELYKEKINL
jgi:bifunctional UDP-N-acetylglucosamine pyrophosphorylase/glucosamine-1-phosphate N-acetyltransferase